MAVRSDPVLEFLAEKKSNIETLAKHSELSKLASRLMLDSARLKYSYNFTWLGRPVIQIPQDLIALQEIIWQVKPDLIIETGIAHGGSLIFHASMLELVGKGEVLGIDVDIREHNKREIENHPMSKRIRMIQSSSIDPKTIEAVRKIVEGKKSVLVILDSNHTHDHVYQELLAYAPFVTKGSYLIVLDTIIEDFPKVFFSDRPWDKGNNPKTAVWEFLKTTDRFKIDKELESKLLLTVAPDGYLLCTKDPA